MNTKFFDAEITNVIDETDSVKRFFFKVSDEIKFRFEAGQFIMLDLPLHTKITNRSYSIASPPNDNNTFELCIVHKPGGLGTQYIWENFTQEKHTRVSQPLGKFLLPKIIETDLCFVCTGTGIAPLRSQLLDIFNKIIPHKNIYFIFGNRFERDILYRKELEELAVQKPEFHFLPVLSRENPDWGGLKGYVHQVYEKIFADHRPTLFYLCGWRVMLQEAHQRLMALGYDRSSIKSENFD